MTTENVVPEEEVNRRRRVNEIADAIATDLETIRNFANCIRDNAKDADEMHCDLADLAELVIDRATPDVKEVLQMAMKTGSLAQLWSMLGNDVTARTFSSVWKRDPEDDDRRDKMIALVKRLFAEAPKMEGTGPEQAPAVECQIVLTSGYKAVGALSTTPEGLLRFMAMARNPDNPKQVIAAEHFFDYDDLETIILPRAQATEQPKSAIYTG